MHNGILILPHYISFIGKLGLKQPLFFTGLSRQGLRQNFMYPTPETKIWCIMESWFYLIIYFLLPSLPSFKLSLGKTWLNKKFHIANSRKKGFAHYGILILPHYICFIGKLGLKQPAILRVWPNMAEDKISCT